ncbi:PREDICTED: anthocyanidin reductase ((2S)-flavan-3-ol-forming)-like [Ipomoea nil]|uniref:anthocyanidin reductase ((2S)-flavan-3-ol-forming)-like n=1 Tax=Ipomoea nil TaxID=35883 RepID=UPI000901A8C8|nr:PREDICTED: anthocyanidin reductase ((2S)-flavan-3-ol-forming)-like [Ipomoea nil]
MGESSVRVCVLGGAGYVGSSLVKKLVEEGYTVHATLRNLSEESKVGLLKSFAVGAEERLKLFEADLFVSKAEKVEEAIRGCEFVFLVASPLPHGERLSVDAIVEAGKKITNACIRCGGVRRLIFTASISSASPLEEDGGYKGVLDETCWTPLPLSVSHPSDPSAMDYIVSKTLAEKGVLESNDDGLEVVSLGLGVVGGDTCLWYCPLSTSLLFSQLTGDKVTREALKFIEDLMGKIPIVHIEDVCDAHIFAIKAAANMSGRFLLANSYLSIGEIATYLRHNYPQFHVNQHQDYVVDDPKRQIVLNYEKLLHKGFTYKKSSNDAIHDSITCGKRFGHL